MSLKEYERKRHFASTPEPEPGKLEPGEQKQLRFVIHKHDASHIHYDLRLEYEGTLKSWALPKGLPTPHDSKKLAVHVEDHPLEYVDFEGRIPEGQYGAGTVQIWDEGTWLPDDEPGEGLLKGKLTFHLQGKKTRGELTLARLKGRSARGGEASAGAGGKGGPTGEGKEWLAILGVHKVGALNPDLRAEGIPAPMPGKITPMQALLVDKPFNSPDYFFEVKFDGIRVLAYLNSEGNLTMKSRNGLEQAFRYPEFADLAGHFLASELVIDGEVIALDEQGVSRFQLLQGRLNLNGRSSIEAAAREMPAYFYVFDILYLDGRDLTSLPLERRKEVLSRIFMPHKYVRLSDWYPEQGETMFDFALQHGLEGIIAKRRLSPYRQKRSRDWLKIKAVQQQEFVVVGFTAPRRARSHFGALLLGLYQGDELVYVGHVGTGFSERSLKELHALMEPLVLEKPILKKLPRTNEPARWIDPKLVVQVKYSEWTREGLLRQPVYLGLREDIDPREVVREVKKESDELAGVSVEDEMGSEAVVKAGPARESATGPAVLADIPGQRSGDRRFLVSGRELKLTNLDKIFWPTEGYTKYDLLDYYHRVSQFIVPHLAGRPLSLKRYPNGAEGGHFFQKEAPPETPAWMHTELISAESSSEVSDSERKRRGKRLRIRYIVCDDEATLLFVANLGCISQNPWLSALPDVEQPDIMAFDIDPMDNNDFEACIETALLVRDRLAAFGLHGYPKTSGASGIHVYVPIMPGYSYDQVRQFAEMVAIVCRNDRPEMISLEQTVSRRAGKRIYLDFRQNVKGKTLASVYSVRAQPGATVSAALEWDEVRSGMRPSDFTIANMPDRLAEKGDLFAGALSDRQDLMAALEQGSRFIGTV